MVQALTALFKKPTTIVGLITALMFQLIFSIIWMTGYSGVTDHASRLRIAVVNEDQGLGRKVAEQLPNVLPFRLESGSTLEQAKEKLNAREVQMVLYIPSDFSLAVQKPGQKGQIRYIVNESNPALIKSIMQNVSAGVTAAVNKEAAAGGIQAVLVQSNIPAPQAQGIALGLADRIDASFESVNPVQGMSNQMLPMMMVLASFVGTMIMGMNLQQSVIALGPSVSRWNKFGARIVINLISGLVIGLIACLMIRLLGGQMAGGFLALWLFESLFLITFMFFTQMFLIVFGMAGMLLNIIMLSVQLVSSGAMVPRELLGAFYHTLSDYLPATYAVRGSMNLLFGGPSAAAEAGALAAILAVCAAVGFGFSALRKEAKAPEAALQPAASRA